MGDVRFENSYEFIRQSVDRAKAIHALPDDEVIGALAAASRGADPFLANVLATEALNRTRRLRAALKDLGEGVVTVGAEGRIHWLNPAAERLLGQSAAEVAGLDLFELLRHEDPEHIPYSRASCPIVRALTHSERAEREGEYFHKRSGELLCVGYTSAPILGDQGEVLGAVTAFRDHEHATRVQRLLMESRQRYQSLYFSLPDPIVSFDTAGALSDANPAAEAFTGVPLDQARGVPFDTFVHPQDAEVAAALFARVAGGQYGDAVFRIRRADGTYAPMRAIGVPIVVNGKVVGMHGVVRPP